MRKLFAFLFVFLFGISASFVFAGEISNLGKRIQEALTNIEALYYKELTPAQKKALNEGLEKALNSILRKNFDSHSSFRLRPVAKTVMEKLEGKYVGIGIGVTDHPEDILENSKALRDLYKKYGKNWLTDNTDKFSQEDKIKVLSLRLDMIGFFVGKRGIYVGQVFKNGGAHLEGVKRGWSIVAVENEKGDMKNISGLVKNKVLDFIQGTHLKNGSKNTTVKIKFVKPDGETVTLKILRKETAPETVWGEMKTYEIGYINIWEFKPDTPKNFESVVLKLKKQGMKKMIIDVRNNPGGTMDAVDGVLDRLVPPGKILIYSESRGEKRVAMWSDYSVPVIFEGPIVVLINGRSASASEVLAGVLKEHGIATLIGVKTFGKGVGQSVGNLKNGGEFRITTFEYILPVTGYRVDGNGIEPHITTVDDPLTIKDETLEMALETLKIQQ